jgi:hypothetical protein
MWIAAPIESDGLAHVVAGEGDCRAAAHASANSRRS